MKFHFETATRPRNVWKATSNQQQESTTKKTIKTHPAISATALNILLFTFVSCLVGTPSELKNSPFAAMKGVPLQEVRWTEGFWAEKIDLCRREMLPSIHRALLDKGNGEVLENLKITAGLATGKYHGKDWSDGDCYKWIEAMAFMYALTKDPELDRLMDEWIGVIGKEEKAAQEKRRRTVKRKKANSMSTPPQNQISVMFMQPASSPSAWWTGPLPAQRTKTSDGAANAKLCH